MEKVKAFWDEYKWYVVAGVAVLVAVAFAL